MTISVIEGVNTGLTSSGVTDANGQFSFAYTGTLLGEDTLQAYPPGFLHGGANKPGAPIDIPLIS